MPTRKRCRCAPGKGFGKRASYLAQVSQSPCKRVITASNFGKYKRIHAPSIEVRGLFIRIGLRHALARRLKVSQQCGVANPSQVLVNQPFKRVGNTFAGIRNATLNAIRPFKRPVDIIGVLSQLFNVFQDALAATPRANGVYCFVNKPRNFFIRVFAANQRI